MKYKSLNQTGQDIQYELEKDGVKGFYTRDEIFTALEKVCPKKVKS